MKVLLINPYSNILNDEPPLGIAHIASFLEKNGIDVKLYDFAVLNHGIGEIKRIIREESPDVLGLTFLTSSRFNAFEIARFANSLGIKVIAGGPHISFTAAETLGEHPYFDFAVLGEGEITTHELLKYLAGDGREIKDINGIAFREDGRVVFTPHRQFIEDLENLPMPAWHLLPMNRYPHHTLMGYRGCCSDCVFCSSPNFWKKKIRGISATAFVDQIEYLIKNYGKKRFLFRDDYFTLNKTWVTEVCDRILRKNIRIKWSCQGRVTNPDESLFRHMKRAGCYQICFGIESGSERVLGAIRKKIDKEEAKKTIRLARKTGFNTIGTFFMLGHPTETEEDMKATYDFALELKADLVSFKPADIFPGTELFETASREGLLKGFNWSRKGLYGANFAMLEDIPCFLPKGFDRDLLSRRAKEFYINSFFDRIISMKSIREMWYFTSTQIGLNFTKEDMGIFLGTLNKKIICNRFLKRKIVLVFVLILALCIKSARLLKRVIGARSYCDRQEDI